MKRNILLCLGLVAALTVRAEQDSALMVHIKSLDGVLEDLATLSEAIETPIPPERIVGPFGGLMRSPSLAGVDTSKPMTIFVKLPEGDAPAMPSICMNFYVEGDGSEYLDSVKAMLPQHENETPSIHRFMTPAGAEGPSFTVVLKNGQVLAGDKLSNMKAMAGDLTKDRLALFREFPGKLSLSVNTAALRDQMIKQMAQQQEMMAKHQEAMKASGVKQDAAMTIDPGAMMESYNTMLQELLVQLSELVVNVDIGDRVSLLAHIKGQPGSILDTLITSSAPVTGPAASLGSPNAVFSMYGSLAGMDEFIGPYAEWVSGIYAAMGPPMNKMADPYRDLVMTMKGLFVGNYSFWMEPSEEGYPLRMAGMYGISDKVATKAAMDKMLSLMKEVTDQSMSGIAEMSSSSGGEPAMPQMNITFKQEPVGTHRGVEIEKVVFSYGVEPGPGMTPEMVELMNNMTYYVAYGDKALYYSMGEQELMHELIDHFQSGSSGAPVRTGFEDIAQPLHGYWALDMGKMMGSFSDFMPQSGPGAGTFISNMANIEAGLRGAAYVEHGGYNMLLRATADDLKGFKAMGAAARPQPGAMPTPPPAVPMPHGIP